MKALLLLVLLPIAGCSKTPADEPDLASIDTGDDGVDSRTRDVALGDASGDAGTALEERPREMLTLGEMPDGAADDDPMVISHDGRLWLAFISDRAGETAIYVSTTTNGEWSDPAQVSDHPDAEWYPVLRRDDAGTFHMVWTRVEGPPDFARHIIYNSSTDGMTWDPATEVAVTTGLVDDVFGHVVVDGTTLRVYFASNVRAATGSPDIFVTSSTDAGQTWSEPSVLGDLASTQTEQFAWVEPFGAQWLMVFVRSAAADATNYLAPSTEIWLSSSANGLDWDAPMRVTNNDAVDALPSLFVDPATQSAGMYWISTHTADGEPIDVQLDVEDAADYPTSRVDLTARVGISGWSPRVAATAEPGLFFAVSVANDTGEPRLYTNWYRR